MSLVRVTIFLLTIKVAAISTVTTTPTTVRLSTTASPVTAVSKKSRNKQFQIEFLTKTLCLDAQ